MVPFHIVVKIKQIPIVISKDDKLIWNASSSREFTTKFAYELIRKKIPSSLICHAIWSSFILLKFLFLAWRIINNLLPIDVNLQK